MTDTLKSRVIAYLKENPNVTPQIIADSLNANRGTVGVILSDLKKENIVESPEYSKYRIRDIKNLDNSKNEENGFKLPDLRLPEVMLAYKEAYGKDQFIDILNKIKRLIE